MMFTPLHSSTNQELFEKYVSNQSNHYEKYDIAPRPSYREVSISLPCQLCSTRHTAVRINNCLKSTYVIKVATMKNSGDSLGTISVMQRKPSGTPPN